MKRIIAFFLFIILLFGVAGCAAAPGPETGTSSVPAASGIDTGSTAAPTNTDLTDTEAGTDTSAGTETNAGTDTGTAPEPEPTPLTLRYDDRYTFPSGIEEVETLSVTSKDVISGNPDEQVLKRQGRTTREIGIAVGVGEAKVTLKDGSVYLVTVTPAPLSVLLITGQSNGEGSTTGDSAVYTKAREQSIVNEDGQVYSTYAWSTTGHSTFCAGLSSSYKLSPQTAARFVPAALTSNKSRAGTNLEYSPAALTKSGSGKTGFDSGLAWSWHKQTGDKVWVINCAAGSTAIEVWLPGQERYDNCVSLMEEVRETLDAEIAAGHYTLKHYYYFWLQGESNRDSLESDYSAKFLRMHTSLKSDILLSGNKAPEGMGIILVRAFHTTDPSTDTYDNGPRRAQKAAAAATTGEFADVFMACDVNDQWISNQGVERYWETTYPGSKYPFTVQSQAYKNPTTIGEVHTGVHYLQPGYNEIGIVAGTTAAKR